MTAFLVALHYGLGVPLNELGNPPLPETPPSPEEVAEAVATFRMQAATPEERMELAATTGFTYAQLTDWVIRADLLRIEGMDAASAALLQWVGVKGVHDLASWHDWRQHPDPPDEIDRWVERLKGIIERKLAEWDGSPEAERFREQARGLDLRRRVEAATALAHREPPHIVAATEVIVIAKGAGSQRSGQTLNVFLNGFWPALKAIEPSASMSRRHDIDLPDVSNPPDKLKRRPLTEIRAGERRIWVTEAHWESGLLPPGPVQALFLEWRMTSFAFGRHLYQFVKEQTERIDPAAGRFTREPAGPRTLVKHYLSFLLQYLLIFLFLGWVFWENGAIDVPFLDRLTRHAGIVTAIALLVALAASLPPALRAARIRRTLPRARLPTLPKGVLLVLILAFLSEPLRYLHGIVLLWLTQMGVLAGRDIAWPFRHRPESDTDLTEYEVQSGDNGKPYLIRRGRRGEKLLLSPVIYRYMIVLVAPMMLSLLTVARVLNWTVILRPIGTVLEAMIHGTLSGVLGDVVTYAMDPARAHHMRSVIEADIAFFHHREEVENIHLFAYSQGTAITYETLFHHLPASLRRKIGSFITIGSPLSYYFQANPVLDELHITRFPVPHHEGLPEDFRWYNFWNAFDPITEFAALDEFKLYELEQIPGTDGAPVYQLRPSPANPTDIRTIGVNAPWGGHTSYFGNLPEVQLPLAFRILGDTARVEWQPRQPLHSPRGLNYMTFLTLVVLPILAAIFFLAGQLREVSYRVARGLLLSDAVAQVQASLMQSGLPDTIVASIAATPSLTVLADVIWLVLLLLLAGAVLSVRLAIVRFLMAVEARAAQARGEPESVALDFKHASTERGGEAEAAR